MTSFLSSRLNSQAFHIWILGHRQPYIAPFRQPLHKIAAANFGQPGTHELYSAKLHSLLTQLADLS